MISKLLVECEIVLVLVEIFFGNLFSSINLYELIMLFIGVLILWFMLVRNCVFVIFVVFVFLSVNVRCLVFFFMCFFKDWFNFFSLIFRFCFIFFVIFSFLNVSSNWVFKFMNLLFSDESFWMCSVFCGVLIIFFCVGLNLVM